MDLELVREARHRRQLGLGAYSGMGVSSAHSAATAFTPPDSLDYSASVRTAPRSQRLFGGFDFSDRTALALAVLTGVSTLLYLDSQRPEWVTRKIEEHDYKEGTSGYDRFQQGGRDLILWRVIAAAGAVGIGSALLLRLMVPRK